jgi:hypothetical protein
MGKGPYDVQASEEPHRSLISDKGQGASEIYIYIYKNKKTHFAQKCDMLYNAFEERICPRSSGADILFSRGVGRGQR